MDSLKLHWFTGTSTWHACTVWGGALYFILGSHTTRRKSRMCFFFLHRGSSRAGGNQMAYFPLLNVRELIKHKYQLSGAAELAHHLQCHTNLNTTPPITPHCLQHHTTYNAASLTMPHHLLNPKWPPCGIKRANGVWGVGSSYQFSLFIFDLIIPSMRTSKSKIQ